MPLMAAGIMVRPRLASSIWSDGGRNVVLLFPTPVSGQQVPSKSYTLFNLATNLPAGFVLLKKGPVRP